MVPTKMMNKAMLSAIAKTGGKVTSDPTQSLRRASAPSALRTKKTKVIAITRPIPMAMLITNPKRTADQKLILTSFRFTGFTVDSLRLTFLEKILNLLSALFWDNYNTRGVGAV